jgi:hypothetical protein
MTEMYPVLDESVRTPQDKYAHGCGELIVGKTVRLLVIDPRFPPHTGSGEVLSLVVPYCPKCQTEPEDFGEITPGQANAVGDEIIIEPRTTE